MTYIDLQHGSDSLRIYEQGAHISSWRCDKQEQLFLSKHSAFSKGKAIRGGVPVIFPQFAALGQGPRHGILRTAQWQLEQQNSDSLKFVCRSTKQTQEQWPGDFEAHFCAQLGERNLSMQLDIINTGQQSFEFAAALHTYLQLEDVRKVQLNGLKGSSYWDNGQDFSIRQQEQQETLRVNNAIDRMYFDVQTPLRLSEANQHREITMSGFSEVVVWNPWAEDTAKLADMADDEYLNMLCVEAAVVDKPVCLQAGEQWQGQQKISLL
ncbi:D-hexose-6-phosphate mutarotase [Agaribacterium sp. ZY112]|uniref:D-hexose-6-phosphate mutarotase n=1 Tax=Agaribacterium sp. ZY112 TaxID=3233574 RepID=UPI0035233865